jgi:hypothetical protein
MDDCEYDPYADFEDRYIKATYDAAGRINGFKTSNDDDFFIRDECNGDFTDNDIASQTFGNYE